MPNSNFQNLRVWGVLTVIWRTSSCLDILTYPLPWYNWINSGYVPIYCKFAKFQFAKYEFAKFKVTKFEFTKFEFNLNLPNSNLPNINLPNLKLPNLNLPNLIWICQIQIRQIQICQIQFCYPLLCLLDLWSTFEGLIKLKQIPFLIYSSIWEIRNCEGRKRETISGRCYSLSGWKWPSHSPQMFITYNLKQA